MFLSCTISHCNVVAQESTDRDHVCPHSTLIALVVLVLREYLLPRETGMPFYLDLLIVLVVLVLRGYLLPREGGIPFYLKQVRFMIRLVYSHLYSLVQSAEIHGLCASSLTL